MNTDTSHDTLDYVIAPTGNGYELRTEFDRSLVSTHRDADAAIQTALNKAAAAGGGTVLLSSGSYPIRSPLRVSTRCTLAGQGTATALNVECEYGVILDTVGQASVKDLRLRADGCLRYRILVPAVGQSLLLLPPARDLRVPRIV